MDIRGKVSIFPYFQHFTGLFKGEQYDSDRPPKKAFKNNMSCKPFVGFIQKTLLDRLTTGAISLLGRVGVVEPPHIVLPLTVEPTKPRLCHDARYLNLWMQDRTFSLDSVNDVFFFSVNDLTRYVAKDSYQTVLDDDKSGYDHILLTEDSRTFFGIQRGGWYFTYNTLPFGWKISPYAYHTIGLMVTNFFRLISVPCLLYIDDRQNGQLKISLDNSKFHWIKGNMGHWTRTRFRGCQFCDFASSILPGAVGVFSWSVEIHFKPKKNCTLSWLFGRFVQRFSFNSRKKTQVRFSYSKHWDTLMSQSNLCNTW